MGLIWNKAVSHVKCILEPIQTVGATIDQAACCPQITLRESLSDRVLTVLQKAREQLSGYGWLISQRRIPHEILAYLGAIACVIRAPGELHKTAPAEVAPSGAPWLPRSLRLS